MIVPTEFEAFAQARLGRLDEFFTEIREIVAASLDRFRTDATWYEDIVEGASVLWLEIFEQHNGGDPSAPLEHFQRELRESLKKTTEPDLVPTDGQIDRVARWVAVYTANSATNFAGRSSGALEKTWIDMDDDRVRPMHRAAAGQTVPIAAPFQVGDYKLHFPGEPVGPPEVWINCRCLMGLSGGVTMNTSTGNATFTANITTFATAPAVEEMADGELTDDQLESEPLVDEVMEVPWHGVLVVEGVETGDKRMFAENSLTYASFPQAIYFQRMSAEGHQQSVVVGRIDRMEKVDNQHRAWGMFNLMVPEANEVVDGLIFGMFGGVSIDIDSPVYELQFDEPKEGAEPSDDLLASLFGGDSPPTTVFTAGRIRGAALVALAAFDEAFVALGEDFDEDTRDPEAGVGDVDLGEDAADAEYAAADALRALVAALDGDLEGLQVAYEAFRDFPADERKKAADSGHAMPDGSYPIENVDDLKNAIQAIGRAKDPAAAKAHIKKRARALGHEELIPEGWNVDALVAAAFAPGTHDGPGWLTNPRATQRLRSYWVHGEGALKIKWGVPGDFNRCRLQLGKYVNPAFLAGTCANLHREALGVWPGREVGKGHSNEAVAFSLVASAGLATLPFQHFDRPLLDAPTPITFDGRRMFGHIAAWGTCHIGMDKTCITPPHSKTNYASFQLGIVETDRGLVPTGVLTMATVHAGERWSPAKALAHYANTGNGVADITVGEDSFGIWFSGELRDDVSDADIRVLQASQLSGDWRYINGNLELIGVLAVNTPGFISPRIKFAMDGDVQLSLVASGSIPQDVRPDDGPVSNLIDYGAIGRIVADELEYRTERRERISTTRDPELIEAANTRRAERIAAARSVEVE